MTATKIPSQKVCHISEMDSSLSSPRKLKADMKRVRCFICTIVSLLSQKNFCSNRGILHLLQGFIEYDGYPPGFWKGQDQFITDKLPMIHPTANARCTSWGPTLVPSALNPCILLKTCTVNMFLNQLNVFFKWTKKIVLYSYF